MSAADASALNWWSFWYSFGTWCVVVGVILEGSEILARRLAERKARRFIGPLPPEASAPGWVHNVEDIGFLILVSALVLEQVSHVRMEAITAREQERLTRQLDLATTQAGDAIKQVGIANERAAALNERATSNEVRVTELQKANLELWKKIQPRRIAPELKTNLVEHLRGAVSGPIVIDSESREIEVIIFRQQIEGVFAEAKIPIRSTRRGISITETAVSEGVRFRVKEGEPPPAHAIAILKAFSEAGFPPKASEALPEVPSGTLVIWIGQKPIE